MDTFDIWMVQVDSHLDFLVGVTHLDLPDSNYWEAWAYGMSAEEMADIVIFEAEEYSYTPEYED